MNKLDAHKEVSHKMLIRHHECTQELEFKHLSAVHRLRRDQQQNQHQTEWSSQVEYNKRAEMDLRKKHLFELKQQPKTLKVNALCLHLAHSTSGRRASTSYLTLSFATSHCEFSFHVATHYLKQRRGEFLNQPTESRLGDHVLYSHDFSDREGVDVTKRNLTLITIGA